MNRIRPLYLALFAWVSLAAQVELKVFEWEGYISTFAEDFEKYAQSKGKNISITFAKNADGSLRVITNPDDIYEVLRAGGADVVTPTHNYYKMEKGKLMKLLLPLDFSRLANYPQVTTALQKASYAEEAGDRYAIPLLGGSYGLAYNAKTVKSPPGSWKALADPKYKNRISITSDQFEANIYVAAILAGTPPGQVYDEKNLNEAAVQDHLNALVQNVKVFWAGMADPKEMKDLDLVTTYWFGVAEANKQGQDWRFVEPAEGQTVWLDTLALAAELKNDPARLEAAYLLADFMISAEVQARIARTFGSVVVNGKASDLWTFEEKKRFRIGDESFYKEEFFWQPLSNRTRNKYKLMWDKARQAAGK